MYVDFEGDDPLKNRYGPDSLEAHTDVTFESYSSPREYTSLSLDSMTGYTYPTSDFNTRVYDYLGLEKLFDHIPGKYCQDWSTFTSMKIILQDISDSE